MPGIPKFVHKSIRAPLDNDSPWKHKKPAPAEFYINLFSTNLDQISMKILVVEEDYALGYIG